MESAKLLVTADLLHDFYVTQNADSLSLAGHMRRSTPRPEEAFLLQAGHVVRYQDRKLLFTETLARLRISRKEYRPESITLSIMV